MAGDKENRSREITPKKAMAYIQKAVIGKTYKQTARDMGIGERTAYRYVSDFEEFLQSSPEYSEAANRLVGMLPQAIDTWLEVMTNPGNRMGNPDVQIATNIIKAAGFLKERVKTERDITRLSDEDLEDIEQLVINNIAGRLDEDSGDQGGEEEA